MLQKNITYKLLNKVDYREVGKLNSKNNSKRDANKIPFRINSKTYILIDSSKLDYYNKKFNKCSLIK